MNGEVTVSSVLTCDTCRGPIDDLWRAMWFWDIDCELKIVKRARLAHKSIDGRRCDDDSYRLSQELWWLASPDAALRRLTDLTIAYPWNAEQLSRLILICWACPLVADKKTAAKARGLIYMGF